MLIELNILWIVAILLCKVDIRAVNGVYICVCLELIVNIVNMPDEKFHTNLLPQKLDLRTDKGDAFTLWEQRWDDYVQLSGLNDRTPEQQMALLCAFLSDDTMKVFLNSELPDTECNVPQKVIEALKGYSHGAINVVIERRNFNLQRQLDGETFDEFLTDLRELVKTLNHCETASYETGLS